MSEHSLFDPAMLEGLLAYGDAAILRRVVETFQSSTSGVPAQIELLARSDDWAGLAFAAHSLKSGSGVMGLTALADLAKDLESAAKAHEAEAAKQAVARLPDLYQTSCGILRKFAAELPG